MMVLARRTALMRIALLVALGAATCAAGGCAGSGKGGSDDDGGTTVLDVTDAAENDGYVWPTIQPSTPANAATENAPSGDAGTTGTPPADAGAHG
jgi:hypothetical protein